VIAIGAWLTVRSRAPQRVASVSMPSPTPAPARPSAAPWTPAQIAALRSDLRAAFAPALSGSERHSLVVIDARGREIYNDDGSHPATPASVQKLIVAYAALNLLEPAYRYHTLLAAPQAMSGSTLDGDLWLIGSGDPSLRSSDLLQGVRELYARGLRRITGRVVVDASAMSGPEINPLWDPNDANEDYQVATSAISIDRDTVEFRVYGTTPGAAARVVVWPKSGALHVSGTILTSSGADDVVIAAGEDPNTFTVSGDIPAGSEEKYHVPVHGMPHYAGAVLDAMLERAGIRLAQPPSAGVAPLTSVVLWDHRSAPLSDLERHMLYVSDNHYAEQLLRTIGADALTAGTSPAGIAAETQFLRSRDIPVEGMHVVDGSGLAEANRVSAATLAHVLSDAALRGGDDLYRLLPEGGKDGTLKYYDFTIPHDRIRAKTGHLSDADSLAGYVDTNHHGRLAFAFMINDSPGDPDDAYIQAVDAMASF
jgi:D-alanyl-D-alanine carboxypeptidase/D-alanyl-D-alanine-endopeptidase (penicillin-binding protein 4)